jgi:hypothetical protein
MPIYAVNLHPPLTHVKFPKYTRYWFTTTFDTLSQIAVNSGTTQEFDCTSITHSWVDSILIRLVIIQTQRNVLHYKNVKNT